MTTADTDRLTTAKTALWRSLRKLCPPITHPDGTRTGGFVVDMHNTYALNAVAHWLIEQPMEGLSLDRGILLRGPVGTGKSDLMRGMAHASAVGGGDGFPIVNVKRIVYEYSRTEERAEQGTSVVLRYAKMPVLCIDDLGTEEDGKHYGKTVNVIADLIAFRYDDWRLGRSFTHFTTNLDDAALSAKYDERTVSRIGEMVNVLPMPGPDRRQESTPRKVLRPRLFDDAAGPDVTPTEEALAKLKDIRATVERIADAKRTNTETQP